jgi:hypothetical protein
MLSDPQAFPNSWEAGPGGSAYVLTRKPGGDELIKCSLVPETPEARIEPLVIQGSTTVSGRGQGAKIDFLRDFVIDGAGNVFFSGSVATGREGLFHLDPSTRMSEPLALEGDPLPPFADGRNTSSLRFGRVSQLLRDSTRGPLLFKASVLDGPQQRQGLFQRSAQGQLETVVVEGLAITGSRDYTVTTIADADLRQTATGMFAFSVKDDNGRWMIIRKRPVRDSAGNPIRDSAGNPKFESVVLARDGQRLEAGRPPVKLNAGPLVSRTGYPPQQGPIFTLNDAGDVAFFASDGQRWAVYEYSDRP